MCECVGVLACVTLCVCVCDSVGLCVCVCWHVLCVQVDGGVF